MLSLILIFSIMLIGSDFVSAAPNALVHPGTGPAEHMNASAAWSDVVPGEVYSVYTEFTGPGAAGQLVGHAYSPAGGAIGTWINLAPIAPTPPYVSEWNPTISASHLGTYYYAAVAHSVPAWPPYVGGSAIIMNATPGGGGPFVGPSPTGPIAGGASLVNWLD
jgi:hypothetical protein